MSKQDINQEFNTFVGGILTEANPINYPVGYTLDEENFILQGDGTRRRRKGLVSQPGNANISLQTGAPVRGLFTWKNANNTGDDVLIIWQGTLLSSYAVGTTIIIAPPYAYTSYTSNLVKTFLDHDDGTTITAVTTFQNKLIVFYKDAPFDTFSTDPSDDTIDIPAYKVFRWSGATLIEEQGYTFFNIRDYSGDINKLAFDDNPVTLTEEHHYNLLSKGWNTTNITQYFTDTGTYPSLSQNMNSGLDAATGVFTSAWVDLANSGEAEQPGGRYIINAFAQGYGRGGILFSKEGYSEAAIKAALDLTGTGGEILGAAEWAGRFCTLVNITGSSSTKAGDTPAILISEPFSTFEDLGNAYRKNDPTSRDFNAPLATDGLIFTLDDIGQPLAIYRSPNGLLITSSRGVFELFARDGIFEPQAISVRRISTIAPLLNTIDGTSSRHPILVNDDLYYLSEGGVIGCKYDSNTRNYSTMNLSEAKIDRLYKTLVGTVNGGQAQGFYSESSKTVRWLLNRSRADSIRVGVSGFYDMELVYDLTLGAWTKNVFQQATESAGYANSGRGVVGLAEVLQLPRDLIDTYKFEYSNTYLVCIQDAGLAFPPNLVWKFMHQDNGDMLDTHWSLDASEVDVPAFLQTGYINAGDSQRFKQTNYIVPSFIRTEDGFTDDGNGNLTPTNESSCIISAWWDYADDETHPKVNPSFEAYRYNRLYIPSGPADTFDYGQSVITTKNRLTGRGRALSLRFESSPGKDCRLLGWGMDLGIQTKV